MADYKGMSVIALRALPPCAPALVYALHFECASEWASADTHAGIAAISRGAHGIVFKYAALSLCWRLGCPLACFLTCVSLQWCRMAQGSNEGIVKIYRPHYFSEARWQLLNHSLQGVAALR